MKKPLVPLLLAAAMAPALAGEAPAPVDRLVACAEVPDSLERLVCFDREIIPFAKSQVAATPAPLPAPAPRSATVPAPAAATAAPSLGEEQLNASRKAREQDESASLTARITELRETGPGVYSVALDNGQMWRHDNQHLGSYLRAGESVTIRKGSLGTYRLTRDAGDSKNWIRVTRIR